MAIDTITADSRAGDSRYADLGYDGTRGAIFALGLKTAFLTLITLGIYRFWGKTRIRKYIWSSISVDGDTLEYTGTGLEKFLGFLLAVVFLAVYLGLVQMLLFYFGLAIFTEPRSELEMLRQLAAIYITLFAALPFILFATYRARRYRLARTRLRGIRFGMENGAWGYVARALGYGLLSIVTLGLLLPLQTFYLEKYMADRTWYGDARLEQHGEWTRLYGKMRHIFIGFGILIATMITAAVLGAATNGGGGAAAVAVVGVIIGYIWIIIGFVSYNVQSFAYLANNKVLGGEVTFESRPETATIITTYLVGALIIAVAVGVVLSLAFAIGFAGFFMGAEAGMGNGGVIAAAVLGGVVYIAVLLAVGAAALALITQPIIAHYVKTLTVHNIGALDTIRQRMADRGADAEGFADALDVGGAI